MIFHSIFLLKILNLNKKLLNFSNLNFQHLLANLRRFCLLVPICILQGGSGSRRFPIMRIRIHIAALILYMYYIYQADNTNLFIIGTRMLNLKVCNGVWGKGPTGFKSGIFFLFEILRTLCNIVLSPLTHENAQLNYSLRF